MCWVRDLLQVQFWKNENRFRASIINLSKPVLPVPALDWFVLIRDDSKSLDPDYQRTQFADEWIILNYSELNEKGTSRQIASN